MMTQCKQSKRERESGEGRMVKSEKKKDKEEKKARTFIRSMLLALFVDRDNRGCVGASFQKKKECHVQRTHSSTSTRRGVRPLITFCFGEECSAVALIHFSACVSFHHEQQ